MQKITAYFFTDFNLKTQTTWFKRLLYSYLIIESSYYLCYFDLLFGENSIVVVTPKDIGFFKSLAFLLYNSQSTSLSVFFISAVFSLALLNFFKHRFAFVSNFLLWFLVLNLNNRVYPTLTGGDNLITQLLFFNCFLAYSFKNDTAWSTQLKICFHNVALLAIMIQVCLLYFVSSVAKLNDPQWISGTAIAAVSQIRYFSMFSLFTYSKSLEPVFIFLNYLVLIYQLLFSVLVWIKKFKKPLLLIGILMHVYIAFVMGLLGFGVIMILVYALFWPDKRTD